MAPPEIRCELVIQGPNLDPDEITEALGFEPTQTWKAGDPIVRGVGVRRSNAWIFAVGPERSYDFDRLSVRLVEALGPATRSISHVCQRLGVIPEVYAPIYVYDEFPNLTFPQAVVTWAAQVGASVAVDSFDLRELSEG